MDNFEKSGFRIRDILAPKTKARLTEEWRDKIQKDQARTGKKGNQHNKVLDASKFSGKHWTCHSASQASTGQFIGYRFLGVFQLENIEKSNYPEDELKKLFKMCFERAKQGADEIKTNADQYLVGISSPLLDWDIRTRFHELDDNTIESLFRRFEIIDQSNQKKDDGRDSITTSPFTVDITAIQTKNRKRKHGGGCGKRQLRPLFHNININALIPINNVDNFCLFRAAELSRAKATLDCFDYRSYKRSENKQQSDLLALINNIEINENDEKFAIEDYGSLIQNYYNKFWPSIFKIFAFKSTNLKPFWKSNTNNWKIPVVVFYHEDQQHYDGVANTGHLFGTVDEKGHVRGKYCFSCEKPYQRDFEHDERCLRKCINCQVVDNGPCRRDGFFESCLACHKTFNNRNCYEQHILETVRRTKKGVIKSSTCKKSKKCIDCKIIYDLRANTNNGRTGHKCGHKYCRFCHQMHEPRPCFINSDPKPEKNDLRYIFFDFEASTQYEPHPKQLRFIHQVNFASAYVTCTRCIAADIWDKPLTSPCVICGPRRTYAFAPFEFQGTDEIKKLIKHEKPIRAFTQWLLHFEEEMAKEMRAEEDVQRDLGLIDGSEEESEDDCSDNEEAEETRPKKEKKKKMTKCKFETVAYAHAGSRYDHVLVFGEIMRLPGLIPKVIRQGNKLYEMTVKKPGHITTTTFRDSYNLIPIRLANFVKTFTLPIETKQHFPHAFNKAENFYNDLPHLPAKEFYGPKSMMPDDRENFEIWFESNRCRPFSLRNSLAEYCFNDVKILTHGMLKMRELFKAKTGFDITRYVTIASAVMQDFKQYLEKDWLALTPHMGYERHDKQSVIATKYLKWFAHLHNLNVQHVENGGEKEYMQYKLDGFVDRGPLEKPLAIEIQGCYHHACPRHYKDENQILVGGQTVRKLREMTAKKRADIEKEMEYIEIWTCEIEEMLEKSKHKYRQMEREDAKRRKMMQALEEEMMVGQFEEEETSIAMDEEEVSEDDPTDVSDIEENEEAQPENIEPGMAKFFDECEADGPIKVSDAFFGGRVGPECLFSTTIANPGKVIAYRDVTSLYPKTNFYEKYPVTHPKVRVYDKRVNWTKPEDMTTEFEGKIVKLTGLIKCKVVPPRHPKLGVVVLPTRIGQRLHFSLCKSCSHNYKKGGTKKAGYSCPHYEDNERAFTITLPHIELEKALEAGYKITHLHRAYEWLKQSDWDSNLFRPYIRRYLKIKYEASGWPSECLDEKLTEEEREKKKKEFMEEASSKYGIVLKAEDIVPNPGLRYLAKLCLNSLWGRFALRNRLAQTSIVDNNEAISNLFNDPSLEITDFEQLNPKSYMIVHKSKEDHVVENTSSNPILALWTTSSARIHLLNGIYRVLEGRKDAKILYMDTDSLIYEYDARFGDPMAELAGDHLGDWKMEYEDYSIIEYVCGGSKAYGLWLRHKKTGADKFMLRCRGITLDCRSSEVLTYESFKERCLRFGEEDNYILLHYPDKNFRREKTGKIYTVDLKKKYAPIISKGHVDENYCVRPFGYSDPMICARDNPYPCICKT